MRRIKPGSFGDIRDECDKPSNVVELDDCRVVLIMALGLAPYLDETVVTTDTTFGGVGVGHWTIWNTLTIHSINNFTMIVAQHALTLAATGPAQSVLIRGVLF